MTESSQSAQSALGRLAGILSLAEMTAVERAAVLGAEIGAAECYLCGGISTVGLSGLTQECVVLLRNAGFAVYWTACPPLRYASKWICRCTRR